MNRNNPFGEGAPRILGVFAHPDDETFCAGGTFHKNASNTVTAIRIPEGIDSKRLLNTLHEQDHIVFGGGQQHLDGKIFRVGHLGFFEEVDLVEAMDKMEMRLQAFGFKA